MNGHELNESTLIAHFKDLEVHLVNAGEAPATMEEIGRIREEEFRAVGAGRGGELDLDRFDTEWPPYSQLVSWDPQEREIVAMYRAIHCGWALRQGGLQALRTAELFHFSDRFRAEMLEYSVELGRSVVNQRAKRALAGLFSVWTGLGAITREWEDIRYFFGNVSLYRTLPESAVVALLDYLFRYHRAEAGLVRAHKPVAPPPGGAGPRADQPRALEDLQGRAAAEGWIVPPILLSYVKAHPGMLAFDVAEDEDFGGALEVAIAVPVEGVSARTVKRFIEPYRSINPTRFLLPESRPREHR
ncbi:MAG: GNAT family N-acetyltransferase [Spirochaetaceae bacterium]|nr:MAG: GNAT family N-acetyltransferase [Spirochaetaceae bacterium]